MADFKEAIEQKDDSSIEFVKRKNSNSAPKKVDINRLIKMTKKRSFEEVVVDKKDDNDNNNDEAGENNKKKKKNRNKAKAKALSDDKKRGVTKSSSIEDADEIERNKYPYEVVPDDHCETPIEAYEDVSSLLQLYAQSISQPIDKLFVYDPYFCEGSMKERLQSLGFDNVYNQKEDFYGKIASRTIPPYDVLLTNPPYSLQHMEQLLDFVFQSQKPFCLLVPNYVYMKDYYTSLLAQHASKLTNKITSMFFLCPKTGRRYQYSTPKGRRQQKSAKLTSPFPTFWFCGNFR